MRTGTAALPSGGSPRGGSRALRATDGFTLVEMLIALSILTFGLLATGQMIYVAASSASLARSKGNAAIAAQSMIEQLSSLYSQDQADANLANGAHGPQQVEMRNPSTNIVLNRFNVSWTVSDVPDPRTGILPIAAKHVIVTVTPINADNSDNLKLPLNKIVTVSTVLSKRH